MGEAEAREREGWKGRERERKAPIKFVGAMAHEFACFSQRIAQGLLVDLCVCLFCYLLILLTSVKKVHVL